MGQQYASTCAVCGAPLTVSERLRGGICARPACGWAQVRRRLRKEANALERAREAAARWHRQCSDAWSPDAEQADGAAGRPAPTVLLPVNTRRLVPLPERRRRRFRDYFTRSLSAAAAAHASRRGDRGEASESGISPFPRVEDAATRTMLAQACGVCRGHCCAQGGEHAFQRPEVVRAYLSRHVGLRPRDVLAAYLEHLPRVSYEGSCVFHTRDGYNLPPDMRSRTCHEYLCQGLLEVLATQLAGTTTRLFVAAMEDETPVRAGVLRRPPDTPGER